MNKKMNFRLCIAFLVIFCIGLVLPLKVSAFPTEEWLEESAHSMSFYDLDDKTIGFDKGFTNDHGGAMVGTNGLCFGHATTQINNNGTSRIRAVVDIAYGVQLKYDENQKYMFIGDSRTVGMSNYKTSNDTFICERGKALGWLKEKNSDIESKMKKGMIVVIWLGLLNDYDRNDASDYYEYINKKAEKWVEEKGVKVCFASIGPVRDKVKGHTEDKRTQNAAINSFNSAMKKNLSDNVHFLDINKVMKEKQYPVNSDGINYPSYVCEDVLKVMKEMACYECLDNPTYSENASKERIG